MRVGVGGRSHEAAQSKYGISCLYRLDSFMPTQLLSRETPLHNTLVGRVLDYAEAEKETISCCSTAAQLEMIRTCRNEFIKAPS